MQRTHCFGSRRQRRTRSRSATALKWENHALTGRPLHAGEANAPRKRPKCCPSPICLGGPRANWAAPAPRKRPIDHQLSCLGGPRANCTSESGPFSINSTAWEAHALTDPQKAAHCPSTDARPQQMRHRSFPVSLEGATSPPGRPTERRLEGGI